VAGLCTNLFSVTMAKNSGGAENSGTNGISFFCSTRIQSAAPGLGSENNVTACNSVCVAMFPTFRATLSSNSERIFSHLKRENQFLPKEICESE
jgi:hypothetical protein